MLSLSKWQVGRNHASADANLIPIALIRQLSARFFVFVIVSSWVTFGLAMPGHAEIRLFAEFSEWLAQLPPVATTDSQAKIFVESMRAVLDGPTDGRQRFLLPTSLARGKRMSQIVASLLPDEQNRQEFERRVVLLLAELKESAELAERSGDAREAFRLRWLHSGFATLSTSQPKNAWKPADSILTPRRPGQVKPTNHPILGWRASSFEWIRTPHFDIASRANKGDSAFVAELCEQVFAVWQQVFFEYWAPNEIPTQPFQVVLFSSKREYEESLKKDVPNIQLSTGYYNQNARHSFFYVDSKKSIATLVHELTHQFFAEACPGPLTFDPDSSPGFWIAEGVALYMESMSIRDLGPAILVDVGGWDASRFQPSRFHFLRNQTWIPCETFGAMTGAEFRNPKDISLRYSHACGLTHFWMEQNHESRQQLIRHVRSFYVNEATVPLTPWNDDELVKAYAGYCRRGPQVDSRYTPHTNRRDAILSRCPIDSNSVRKLLTTHRNWDWLDLSFTSLSDSFFEEGSTNWNVVKLSVEGSKITDKSCPAFREIPQLEELDLSQCSITDEGVAKLQGHPTLKILWLSGTQITDKAVKLLASLPKLETVHVDKSSMTSEGWTQLLKLKPRLKLSSTAP